MRFPWLNSDDMSEEERHEQNCNLKDGIQPEGVWEDWGDCDKDHRKPASQKGLKASTREEVEAYYDQRKPSGWWTFGGRK